MNTPIYDFIKQYSESKMSRFHMPGHKGQKFLGPELFDITEIDGADVLTSSNGIISESQKNATQLFDTGATFYSTEGSTLCIKTMLYSLVLSSDKNPEKTIIAVRNVHKSFIYACAQLNINIKWIYPQNRKSLCSGIATVDEIKEALLEISNPIAMFITSPNYLGETSDIKSIAKLCHKKDIPLVVDNAHGAYLKFCDLHPIHLGADMCCDSAHKTLPVLTGGAYLHISKKSKSRFSHLINHAMSAFSSTSPSYLTLDSLDLANKYIYNGFKEKLDRCIQKVESIKKSLKEQGYSVLDTDPLKLTIETNGEFLHSILKKFQIQCEYYDKTNIVFMITPENSEEDLAKLHNALLEISPKKAVYPPVQPKFERGLSPNEAFLLPFENIDIHQSEGSICADTCVSCPPAVPIVTAGEIINQEAIKLLEFYGHKKINIIKSRL